MRRAIAWSALLALVWSQLAAAGGNSWNRIRYSGGTVPAKTSYDWDTTLSVAPDSIVLVFGHRQTVHIRPAQVTGLSYGSEAHRRVAEMVAFSALVNPVALFGLLHKSKDHFIGIEYQGDEGKPSSILLEAHKDIYLAILKALKDVTGKPVANAP